MYNYIVDWEEFGLIRDYLRKEDQVADVGANMGYYTVWMSKFIRSGCIHAFEPDMRNFQRLTENCRINKLEQVKLNRLALSDKDGEALFTCGLDGENHIAGKADDRTVTVTSATFDKYCLENKISRISYAKVDIEGFEYFFLKGAQKLIERKGIDIIQIEINDQTRNAGITLEELLSHIREIKYTLCGYDSSRKQLYPLEYARHIENYLLVADLESANHRIKENMSIKKR